jgi:hypothetical protein
MRRLASAAFEGILFSVAGKVVEVNPGAGRARMRVTDLETDDYGDLCNALSDGEEVEADVSFDVRWSDPMEKARIRNAAADQRFTGLVMPRVSTTFRYRSANTGKIAEIMSGSDVVP